jgi:hypothetical protein
MAPGEEGIVSNERVRWWAPLEGYASSSAGSDAFGLTDDLHLVTLASTPHGVMTAWEEYYDAAEIAIMCAHFDEALADSGANLARRFSGHVIECAIVRGTGTDSSAGPRRRTSRQGA